jgi:hypothetical protein
MAADGDHRSPLQMIMKKKRQAFSNQNRGQLRFFTRLGIPTRFAFETKPWKQ